MSLNSWSKEIRHVTKNLALQMQTGIEPTFAAQHLNVWLHKFGGPIPDGNEDFWEF